MADRRITETGDVRITETGDTRILEAAEILGEGVLVGGGARLHVLATASLPLPIARFLRRVIGGDGSDKTALVAEWLRCRNELTFADLYLLGEPDDPRALWLTNWETPLKWLWGEFCPAVIKRGPLKRKIGFEVDALTIEWSPPQTDRTQSVETANPYQLAQIGYYDNWPFRLWTAYMPQDGDAWTFGASEEFGGRIGKPIVSRGKIELTITSFLDVVNQSVPTNVIELTNTLAAHSGPTPPEDLTEIPQFALIAGSTQTKLIARATSPDGDRIFDDNVLRGGFVVFNRNAGQPLGGVFSTIYANRLINVSGTDYNEIVLYNALPWAPVPGTDTCWISRAFPVDISEGRYQGFPRVPDPRSSI